MLAICYNRLAGPQFCYYWKPIDATTLTIILRQHFNTLGGHTHMQSPHAYLHIYIHTCEWIKVVMLLFAACYYNSVQLYANSIPFHLIFARCVHTRLLVRIALSFDVFFVPITHTNAACNFVFVFNDLWQDWPLILLPHLLHSFTQKVESTQWVCDYMVELYVNICVDMCK